MHEQQRHSRARSNGMQDHPGAEEPEQRIGHRSGARGAQLGQHYGYSCREYKGGHQQVLDLVRRAHASGFPEPVCVSLMRRVSVVPGSHPTYGTYLRRPNGQPAGLKESLRWFSRSGGATEVVAKPPRQNARARRRVALQDAQEYLRFWKARYSPSPVTCKSEGDGYVLCSTGIRAFNKSVSKRLVRKVMAEADWLCPRREPRSRTLHQTPPLKAGSSGRLRRVARSNESLGR